MNRRPCARYTEGWGCEISPNKTCNRGCQDYVPRSSGEGVDYWQTVRADAASKALEGMLMNNSLTEIFVDETEEPEVILRKIAEVSVKLADMLVEELKKI